MPGSFVRDAFEPALETGITLTAAATATGTGIDCMRPRDVRVELKTATVASTANSATISVEIQASDSSTFASGVVSCGRFAAQSGTDAAQSNLTKYLEIYTQKRYIRAKAVIGGTAPDYTGTTIRVIPENARRSDSDTA